jgi:hypothetical protein
MSWRIGRASALTAAAVLATGCGDSIGVPGTGAVQVTLQRIAAPGAQIAGPLLSVTGGEKAAGAIDLDNILCLDVRITGVHLLPVVEDDPDTPEEEEAEWVRLNVTPFTVDLTRLPRVGDDQAQPLAIVFDPDVPVGDYRKVRFITADETPNPNQIFFETEFEVGRSSYQGNLDGNCTIGHPVNVPSGSQSGLKIDMEFTVESADGNPTSVDLLFDEHTSIRNAVATGSGRVNLTPVLRSRP